MDWLVQYFVNPGYVLPGAALASVPVVIHLLSRLRYRRVRFAAMEFLLESDEQNRRRLILEQLLLLALRVLAVILIGLLISRLILDPSRMLMMRGSQVHHLLILDDSLSMRARDGAGTVFERARETLENMLAEGAAAGRRSRVTILRASEPDRPVVSDMTLDNGLLQELIPRLRNLQCTYQVVPPDGPLRAAAGILSADDGMAPHVHFLTDLRARDWIGQSETQSALEDLDEQGVRVHLLGSGAASSENLAVVNLETSTASVARGIPFRIHVTVRNYGAGRPELGEAEILVDGELLAGRLTIPELAAGEETVVSRDLVVSSVGRHLIEVRFPEDPLTEDSRRYLVVEAAERRQIMIVDDAGQQNDARFVAAALSADSGLTGLEAAIRTGDALSRESLERYDCIYLLNVRDLAPDSVVLLRDYVRSGGGIVWFPGDQADIAWYSARAAEQPEPIFPVPVTGIRDDAEIAAAVNLVQEDAAVNPGRTPVFGPHPVFEIYNAPDSPFPETVRVRRWLGLSEDWSANDADRADGVRTLVRLDNGDPLVLEHQIGAGRVITFLTSAGNQWSNWPVMPAAPGYVVMHLLLHEYLQAPPQGVVQTEIRPPLMLQWAVSEYTDQVEVFLPANEGGDSDQSSAGTDFVRLTAVPVTVEEETNASASVGSTGTPGSEATAGEEAGAEPQLRVAVRQANRPGLCRVRQFRGEGEAVERWFAMNIAEGEGDLTAVIPEELEAALAGTGVQVVADAGEGALGTGEAGRELRYLLLGLLVLVLVCEQRLALRLSFHSQEAGR